MPDVDIRVNLADFKRQLKALGRDMEKKIVRSAANAAAQQFKKAVIAEAPVLRTPNKRRVAGTLKRSIYVFGRRRAAAGTLEYSVSFRKGRKAGRKGQDAFYGRYLEEGWIPRGPGKKLRGGTRSKALQRTRALAGGASKVSYPFLLPGFNRAKDAALRAFYAKMQQRIDKANRER